MAEVVLFHHAQGLTSGVGEFAETLRRAGHTVHVPDLYEGRVFATLEDGIGYAQETGIDAIIERAHPPDPGPGDLTAHRCPGRRESAA
jgi:dienelactone hydrolase